MSAWTVTVPVRTWSPNGGHGHWRVTHGRRAAQRAATDALLRTTHGNRPPAPPLAIRLVRVAPRKMDSHDNLRFALKGVADAVARWLKIDDGSDLLTWSYAQEAPAKARTAPRYAVRIEITEGA